MELRFGLEFEANVASGSSVVADLADELDLDVDEDCSVRRDTSDEESEWHHSDECGEWVECDNTSCLNWHQEHPRRCWHSCEDDDCDNGYWSENDDDNYGAAELKSNGPVTWFKLVGQYRGLRARLGEQDETAGVHTHVSVECDCGYRGHPILTTDVEDDPGSMIDAMVRFVGEGRLYSEYVQGIDWDGVLVKRGAYNPVVISHFGTTEIRWFHSSLNGDQYVEAMRFMLRHMACGGCGRPVGNDEIFVDMPEFAEAMARWAREFDGDNNFVGAECCPCGDPDCDLAEERDNDVTRQSAKKLAKSW